MIEIDYNFLNDLFERVWGDSDFSAITMGLKIMAISFLLIRLTWIIYKSWADRRSLNAQSAESGAYLPISPRQFGTYVALCLCAAFYDQVLLFLDTILGSLISVYSSLDVNTVSIPLSYANQEAEDTMANASAFEALKIFALQAIDVITSPTLWILSIVKVLAWLMDIVVYSIFIIERFFVLLILKFTGPLAISLSLVPKLNAIFWKWAALYMRWYLLIIPYLLVNLVVNVMVESYELIFASMGTDLMQTIGETLEVPLLLVIVVLKLVLYRTAKTIYNEVIDINMNEDD